MELLRNSVRPYAWGSRTAIASLLGAPTPAPHPQAELWLGAHPADSSVLRHADGSETSLIEALTLAPEYHLGPECANRWAGRLPFLLKVLAAEEPLSLQAHPSAHQAAEGYAREQALGIPLDAPERNYKDPSHKPELVCAMTEFHALAGFRDALRTVELLTALESPALYPYRDILAAQPDQDGLRALFTTWITLPQQAVDGLLPSVVHACVEHLRAGGKFGPECRVVLELAEGHPGDAGVLAAALLNYVVLEPGDAMYLPAGNLHTYLRGTAVEIMANSDNVLRGGLTPKHVDVAELLRILDFSDGPLALQRGRPARHGETRYPTPATEFELSRLDWEPGRLTPMRLPSRWPQIVLCTQGEVDLHADDGTVTSLVRGDSAWLPAAGATVTACPDASPCQLFRATVGLPH